MFTVVYMFLLFSQDILEKSYNIFQNDADCCFATFI